MACSHLPYRGLIYEVQYRSTFDTEWQVRMGPRARCSRLRLSLAPSVLGGQVHGDWAAAPAAPRQLARREPAWSTSGRTVRQAWETSSCSLGRCFSFGG